VADDDYIMGELARSDLYPDESQMQPPANAPGGLTPEDWMLSGQQPPQATYDYVPPQSWLQKAGDLARRDVATYQQGGVPAMMGQLAEDSSGEQDLAGGFGGNIKGVEGKLGALADLAPHAPPFYSAVERAVQDAKQNTAPGQQWAGFLRNQPGVKPEEVETLGLGKLFEQPTVSKDAVLGEIAANKVNVGEVVKGAPDPSAAQLEKVAQERYGTSLSDPYLTEGQRMAVRDEAMSQSGAAPTKFSSYTLPGGENYREMLLTLPTEKRVPSPDEIENIAKTRYEGYHMKENDPPWERLAPDVQRLYREDANAKIIAAESPPQFRSSHFDEPNILAHIRTNDRVIDGKKTLFVEEVQSDWHQKGKREGYGLQITPEAESLMPEIRKLGISEDPNNISSKMITDAGGDYNLATKWWNLVHDRQVVVSKGPPDAPFKTTWPDLAMKRVIREAAEKGYDKVAWTPGSVQADRYDLSKQVSKVRYTNNDYLHAFDHNGKEVIAQVGVTPEKLADYLGKDVAQKMLDQTPKDFSRLTYVNRGDLKVEQSEHQYHVTNPDGRGVNIGKGTVGSEGEALDYAERYLNKTADEVNQKRLLAHEHHGPVRELSGLDLKVGGEGMKGFYDEILPATVNKLVKKHGARVEQAQLGGTIPQFSMEGHGPWVVRDQNGTMLRDFNNRELAEAYLKQRQADVVKQTTPIVHSVTITPQLREMALKKGFPLFTAGGLVAGGAMGDLARQDQYD
jgi:hypothetical protein